MFPSQQVIRVFHMCELTMAKFNRFMKAYYHSEQGDCMCTISCCSGFRRKRLDLKMDSVFYSSGTNGPLAHTARGQDIIVA